MPASVETLLALFAPPPDGEALIFREGAILYLGYALGGGRYVATQFVARTLTHAGTLTTLGDDQIRAVAVAYAHDDAAISPVYAGGGWGVNADAELFGGSYYWSATPGANATWITPAPATRVGMLYYRTSSTSSGAVIKVEIDGDATRANLLPTAQQRVNDGFLSSAALVANGGTLNPTDRVLDQYRYTSTLLKNTPVLFADDLAAAVHTVKLTNSGFHHTHAQAQGIRLYADALLAGSEATALTDANAFLPLVASFSGDTGSAKELAITFVIAGQVTTPDFLGNIHDYERELALAFTLDGAPVTLADGEFATGSEVGATLLSALRHPDLGTFDVADIQKEFTVTAAEGLLLEQVIAWHYPGTTRRAYTAMFPLGVSFDRGTIQGAAGDYDLTPNTGGFVVAGISKVAYEWQSTGYFGAMFYVPRPEVAVNNWLHSSPSIAGLAIEDRNPPTTNKIYLTRSTEFSPEPIAAGDVWRAEVYYRIQRFPDGAGNVLAGLNTRNVYALTLNQSTHGSLVAVPDDQDLNEGTRVVLTATPDSGYQLLYWSLNGVHFWHNPLTINIEQDIVATPTFALVAPPIASPDRARCPFCHGAPGCAVCAGTGWVRG